MTDYAAAIADFIRSSVIPEDQIQTVAAALIATGVQFRCDTLEKALMATRLLLAIDPTPKFKVTTIDLTIPILLGSLIGVVSMIAYDVLKPKSKFWNH